MAETVAIEIVQGRSPSVMAAAGRLLSEAWALPWFGRALDADVWVGLLAEGAEVAELKAIPDVLTVETTADHVFYASPFPTMREATIPGVSDLPAEDVARILRPVGKRTLSDQPFGAPGAPRLSGLPDATLSDLRASGSWDRILSLIRAREAWRYNRGEGAIIAVVDSGVDATRLAPGQLVGAWSDCPDVDPLKDDVGHGTMAAMIAASRAEVNGFDGVAPGAGVFVVAPSRDARGAMSTHGIMRAMDMLMELAHHFKGERPIVMNNSWGLYGCKSLLLPCRIIITRVMAAADRKNICCPLTVWAVGNNHLMGCETEVDGWCMNTTPVGVSVGAVDLWTQLQPYSSVGGQCFPLTPTVVAPTGGVLPWGSGFKDFGELGGGTSSAAPQASGALAILSTAYPRVPKAQLRAALRRSARRLGPDRDFNEGTGSGLLQVDRAVEAVPGAQRDPSYRYERRFLATASTLGE